jgi:hypothetical protein
MRPSSLPQANRWMHSRYPNDTAMSCFRKTFVARHDEQGEKATGEDLLRAGSRPIGSEKSAGSWKGLHENRTRPLLRFLRSFLPYEEGMSFRRYLAVLDAHARGDVALGAAKAGIALTEPLCQVTYRHEGVTSDVRLTLRIAEFRIDEAAHIGA